MERLMPKIIKRRQWIEDCLKERGKKKKDLAEALGLPHTRIYDLLDCKRSLKITEIIPFAEFMHMSIENVVRRFNNLSVNEKITN